MDEVFVHERGLCESENIGAGTRIWAFAHVLPGATVGADCNLCDGVFVEDDVFVGPNATFTNDPFPRSRHYLEEYPRIVVRAGASIGANATILPGLEIGRGAMVGAGAVVTRPVPPNAIVKGNPARIHGYVETGARAPEATAPPGTAAGTTPLGVRGVHVQRFPEFADLRGKLSTGDLPSEGIPFSPQRWFMVYDVPSLHVRGEHAHRACEQFLICVSGQVMVAVDDGENRAEVMLDGPTVGIYIPPRIWGSQFRYDSDAVLLVLASLPYDPDDYIRDYDEFLASVNG